MKYASIVPLIGGETIGMEMAFGQRPEYMLSYSAFQANDSQIVSHYNNEVPYYLIDQKQVPSTLPKVDVVNSVCPCAGLSSLSPSASSDNKANDWMVKTAKYVLEMIQPSVFWGENAPRLASKMGEPTVAKLRSIAHNNGYTFSLYKTKSILHGLSQVRDRSFYFFWKGDSIPYMPFFKRDHEKIEDTIRNCIKLNDDPMNQLVRETTPSEEPFYRYVLEEIEGGITHQEFQKKIESTINPLNHLERSGRNYDQVAKWMKRNGFDKQHDRCLAIHKKLEQGGNIMRKTTEIPKNKIGAFVGHMPLCLTHPNEDRYLTIRECLAIMKMPVNFQLQGGKKNLNMICQNVPVTTAFDMALSVKMHLNDKLDKSSAEFMIQDNRNQTNDVRYADSNLLDFIK